MKEWSSKPYHSLNHFLRERFGEKVYKISLDGGFSCPNRDGHISNRGCTFCSARGSGDFAGDRNFDIPMQFQEIRTMMEKKWKGGKTIAYFQAYTNTYAPVALLKEKYEAALAEKDVVGISIATRPDCLEEPVLDLLEHISKDRYTFVELGLQTASDRVARGINRGYDLPVFQKAVKDLRARSIDVVVHVIFGLPGETLEEMLKTVRFLSRMDIQGVKFHLLHLMKHTPMVKLYEAGGLRFLSMEEYVDLVVRAVALLPEEMVIHRLTGDAPRDLLIGPLWSLKKWEVLNAIDATFKERGLYQGIHFKP